MSDRTFEERYQANDTPWDRDHPDENLMRTVRDASIRPCRALDVGCGTGMNTRWLAERGFEVTGVDLSPTAISIAEKRAKDLSNRATLFSGDLLDENSALATYDFVFDRGAFHCFDGEDGKQACVNRIADLLSERGLWLSLIGNADDTPREVGPPTLTASEVARFVESRFEILSLTAGEFGGGQDDPPKAWICLMRKRDEKPAR